MELRSPLRRTITAMIVVTTLTIMTTNINQFGLVPNMLRHRSLQLDNMYRNAQQKPFSDQYQPLSYKPSVLDTRGNPVIRQDQRTNNGNYQNTYSGQRHPPQPQQAYRLQDDTMVGNGKAEQQAQNKNGGFGRPQQSNGLLQTLQSLPAPQISEIDREQQMTIQKGKQIPGGSYLQSQSNVALLQPLESRAHQLSLEFQDQDQQPQLGSQQVKRVESNDQMLTRKSEVQDQTTPPMDARSDQPIFSRHEPIPLFSSGITYRLGDDSLPNQLQSPNIQQEVYSQSQQMTEGLQTQGQFVQEPLIHQMYPQKQQQQQQQQQQQPLQQGLVQQQAQKEEKHEEAQQHVSVPDQDPNCVVPNAAEVAVRDPTWTASYPGSGAKLTWKLIRAITGIFTSDDHDHNGRVEKGMVVAIKTHFPSHTDPQVFYQDKLKHISRSVLLTRNPINSIPSYHNFVYEQQNGLLNHSTRAPIEAWIKWRNEWFEIELKNWIDHQKYWLDNYSREGGRFHLVSMEHLTSKDRGPGTLQELGAFLASGGQDIRDSMVPAERMPCIWEMFVLGKVPGERERRNSHRSGGPKEYPFTQLQLDQMIQALLRFKGEYPTYTDLGQIVDEYVVAIEEKKTQIQQL